MTRAASVLFAIALATAAAVCSFAQAGGQRDAIEGGPGGATQQGPKDKAGDAASEKNRRNGERAPEDKAKGDTSKRRLGPADPRAYQSFTDDMDRLTKRFALTEDQSRKILALRDQRDKALARWDAQYNGRIAKAEEALLKMKAGETPRRRREIAAYLRKLYENRLAVAMGYEGRMFACLDKAQKANYNSHALFELINREFHMVQIDEAQAKRIQQLCDSQGKRMGAPLSARFHGDYLRSAYEHVYKAILNNDQKEAYAKVKLAEKAERDKRRAERARAVRKDRAEKRSVRKAADKRE